MRLLYKYHPRGRPLACSNHSQQLDHICLSSHGLHELLVTNPSPEVTPRAVYKKSRQGAGVFFGEVDPRQPLVYRTNEHRAMRAPMHKEKSATLRRCVLVRQKAILGATRSCNSQNDSLGTCLIKQREKLGLGNSPSIGAIEHLEQRLRGKRSRAIGRQK